MTTMMVVQNFPKTRKPLSYVPAMRVPIPEAMQNQISTNKWPQVIKIGNIAQILQVSKILQMLQQIGISKWKMLQYVLRVGWCSSPVIGWAFVFLV